ncbi:toxin-antitoxin system, antitoxin component, AbrB family protein [Salmonella enterica]|nr:toxin-antitoxin system, antitoxin component, AbrB family protein [Salmonella enterica]EBS3177223.1 toxin-antitoxin system, antitoxin component, AbrB family protein [Salmonella enterica subsp. enterica serovar Newport]EBS3869382.1 toxin-antitoxin system, antitoxin component, AbrB family protein [Salmonella enterica subsp. enterica serovar Kimberley]EDL3630099.1 toxin-antitoxin system, antitoxin component, AbrB family protein [Salmonella enterica subsp. enterica serovar Newport]EGU8719237.1 to
MSQLYICPTSAYTEHMHTSGDLNIPDMLHISI